MPIQRRDRAIVTKDLKQVAIHLRSLPPAQLWGLIRPILASAVATQFERQWTVIGVQLDRYCTDQAPLGAKELTPEEIIFVNAHAAYYQETGWMIFLNWHNIQREFERGPGAALGIEFPFERRSDLLKELITEECLGGIELMLSDFWESPSANEAEKLWETIMTFFSGGATVRREVKSLDSLTPDEWQTLHDSVARVWKKLHWEPTTDPILSFWNDFCRGVFFQYRDGNYYRWLNAKRERFDCAPWVKHFWQRGHVKSYPGRGKRRSP